LRVAPRTLAGLLTAFIVSACVTITPVAHVPISSNSPPDATTSQTPARSSDPDAAPTPTRKPSPKPNRTPVPATIDPDDPGCADDAYTLEGFKWNTTYRWHFNRSSVPADLDADATLTAIEAGFDNIVTEHNNCGRPDTIHAKALYQGDTSQKPCADRPDGQNTVSFGDMPSDTTEDAIAYTCPYIGGPDSETQIAFDADIVISDEIPWSLGEDACFFQFSLEATVTHEVGHVFGLDHVSEREHGELTMSTTIENTCDDSQATLGLGDMLGLEELYGPGD
jgi:hypothetical protein